MNNKYKLLFALAAGLFAVTAQAANIQISSLPFAITAPGTYVLTGNLSTSANVAITVSTALSGPVVLDLKGFTLTGNGGDTIGIGIGSFANTFTANTYPITVRNGTLRNFGFGLWAEVGGVELSNITVNGLTFFTSPATTSGNGKGVLFDHVDSSTISNCTFTGGQLGIEDASSRGGNTFNNDTFNVNPLFILIGNHNGISTPLILDHYQIEAPPL